VACRTINLESGLPSLDEARRALLRAMDQARKDGVRVLKVIHGYGSSGGAGVLCAGIRRSLRLRLKEGKATLVIPGETFSSDANDTRLLLSRHPSMRGDRDLNRANLGITIVELA
jgi:Smr domain